MMTLPGGGPDGDGGIKPGPGNPTANDAYKTFPIMCGCNIRRQGAGSTRLSAEAEAFQFEGAAGKMGLCAMDTTCRVTCPAGQVQAPATRSMAKSSLGKCLLSGLPGTRAGSFRPASPKSWRVPPVAICSVSHGLTHQRPSADPALLYRAQCTRTVPGFARRQVRHRDQPGVGVHHHRSLVPINTVSAALMAVAHFRVMRRHDPVLAHPVLRLTAPSEPATWSSPSPTRFTSWSSSCPGNSAHPARSAVERCRLAVPPWVCRANSESRPASATIPASSFRRACRSKPPMAASPFTVLPTYRL